MNLTDFDYQNLERSFIRAEIAEQAGLFRVDSTEGAERIGRKAAAGNDYSGVIFPYFLPEDRNPREYRLRRDKPDLEEKNGVVKEKAKYLSPPGRQNMIYFPPNCRKEWLEDISIPIVLTEGEKKTLALHRAAWHNLSDSAERPLFVALGLSGVWNFRGTVGKTNYGGERRDIKGIISDFQFVEWRNRRVTILFDANASANKSVRAARSSLARELKNFGAKVFVAELPKIEECNGIDDVLGKIEREESAAAACKFLFDLIEKATGNNSASKAQSAKFDLRADGVYYADNDEDFRVCSSLKIVAETQTENGGNYGRLLEWRDSQNRLHRWAMPIEFVHSEGAELVKYLASNGLEIMPTRKHREKLAFYIATSKPEKTIISTDKIGWHNECFVLPNETFGSSDNEIVYQSEYDGNHNFKVSGTLDDWQSKISKYCSKNSRLLFAVSAALSAPLLPVVQMQGGGFHFRGSTSTGKTTASLVGGSVWGGDGAHGFVQTWKATANGLEIIAAQHNHALLCLDEIGECDNREIGNVAYMLANGRGKLRMAKTLQARNSLTWNLLFISTGEQSLADKISESGGTVKGGQEIRFCDIEADTGRFGLFENLHDFSDGQSFSDHLRSASCVSFGAAIRKFLSWLTSVDVLEIRAKWHDFQNTFVNTVLPDRENAPSEVLRVAARFALVALGGELATDAGITKWQPDEAYNAAKTIFLQWMNGREGKGQTDAENAVRQVRVFLEKNGASLFQNVKYPEEKVINRAGYFRRSEATGEIEYFILPETFRKDICRGFDYRFVAKVLTERGYMETGGGSLSKVVRLSPEIGTVRVYCISDMLTEKINAASS